VFRYITYCALKVFECKWDFLNDMINNTSYKNIISRLENVSRRYLLVGAAEAICAAIFIWCILAGISSLTESVLFMPPVIKRNIILAAFAVSFLVFIILLIIRFFQRPGTDELARMVERAFPNLKERCISAVQLGRLGKEELKGQSEDIVKALVAKVQEELLIIDMTKAVVTTRLEKMLRFNFYTFIILLIVFVLFPGRMMGGLYRLVDFSHAYNRPGKISIFALKQDCSIIRGNDFTTPGFVSGNDGKVLHVFYRWDDSSVWNMKPIEVDHKTGNFTATIEKPRLSLYYYLESGNYKTTLSRVTVIERPVAENIEFMLSYPEYTGLGTVSPGNNDGNIRILRGTKIAMTVRANKPLSHMAVHWSDSTVTPCNVTEDTGTMTFTVDKTIDYYLSLVDTLGIMNHNPITYRITSLIDEHPSITIASPASGISLPISMTFPVVFRAADDYGLTSVVLIYKLPHEEVPEKKVLKRGMPGKFLDDQYIWNMSDLGLLPNENVSFYLAVYDNDTVSGPKRGISETRLVHVPSMTDLLQDIADGQNESIEKLRDMSGSNVQEELSLEDIKNNIINGKDADWSDKNTVEQAKERLEKMQKDLREISGAINEAAQKLSDEDMAALETLEKYQKISDLMEQIAEGELKEALKQLTKAQIAIEPHKIKEAIDKYQISTEDLKEKLDRIISLFEQVKSIQRFETAKRLLEEIVNRQAEVAEQYRQDPENSSLSREQKMLASEMDSLLKEMKEAAKELKENFQLDTKPFEAMLDSSNVTKTMREASQHMSDGLKQRAEKSLNRSNMMLSDILESMDALNSALKNTNSEELKRRLFTSLSALLAVSEKQENLVKEIESASAVAFSGGGQVSKDEIAQLQIEVIDGFSKAEQALKRFGALVFELSGVLDYFVISTQTYMEKALDAYAAGNIESGLSVSTNALSNLNKSIHFLTTLMKSSENEGKGMPGDLLQQLQKIANGELSLQTQMNADGSEQMMMQLAAEQQKLAEMLSELGKKLQEDKRLQEMLEKIAGDMDETADLMRRNEKRVLIERKQLDIYRRLLDARRSKRKKDDEDTKRKSWTAKRDFSRGADKLAEDLGEKKRFLNEQIKRALKDDFNPEYKRLIRSYFESMLQDYDEYNQGTEAKVGK